MAATRITRSLAHAWVVLLAVVVTGPALLPGFTLSYDLVFTPRQDLLPGSLGVGGGLPRAVPQDAAVAIVETLVPGQILEKVVLLVIPLLAGMGMLRLLRGTAAGVVAATLAIANPFVAQRLAIGHWGFLLAYALLPWALVVAARLRARGEAWDGVRLLLLVAAGSLTPSGSLLMAIVAIPAVLLPGSAYPPRLRAMLAAGVTLTWVPWLLPALLHPVGTGADPDGTGVFALRPDAPGGAVVSALTGGGIWNAEVVLASRGTALTWIATVAVLGLAVAGFRRLARSLGEATTTWWTGVAVAGLVAALASTLLPGPWGTIIETIPGGGLARDAHKLLAPWVLLVTAAAGSGAALLARLVRERSARIVVVGALAVLPVACMPDMLWGLGGRWQAVDYPDDWTVVRTTLQQDARPGDVASFPWTAFRRFAWNGDRTVLDPAPRWLPRTTVVADNLVVATPAGVVDVSGDDPRARAIDVALTSGQPVGDTLASLGIGWAVVALGTPGPVPELPGWELVVDGDDLVLYAAPAAVEPARSPAYLPIVAAADAATVLVLLGGVAGLAIRRVRVQPGQRLVP